MVTAVGIGIGAATLLLGIVAGMVKIATVYREEWRAAVGLFARPVARLFVHGIVFVVGWSIGAGRFGIAEARVLAGFAMLLALSGFAGLAWAIDRYIDRKNGGEEPR